MNIEIWHIFILALLILNILVSVFIARIDYLDIFQKSVQIVIVWLIPFVAAIGLWMFHRSNDDDSSGSGPIGGGPNPSSEIYASGD